jgi:hypothetical protein
MTNTTIDETAEVVSLSNRQVTTLLKTLTQHRSLLEVAHEDARRLAISGRRPAYLVDFELLYRYMFQSDERPEWDQELRYLFDREDTTFLFGPGTLVEIDRLVHSAGFVRDAEGKLQDILGPRGTRRAYGRDEAAIIVGLERLQGLVEAPNFRRYEDVVEPTRVDDEAFETAMAALEKRRSRRASDEANRADAFNWAAVIHLRRIADQQESSFHPYLLTATRPLLDEKAWSDEITAPVSRQPAEAIYTEVLLEFSPEPAAAANHTVQMAWEAAKLEKELRSSPAYLNPSEFRHEIKWEHAIENRLVGDGLREQLTDMTKFVTDPVVLETQRIYDNAHLASVSAGQQRGSAARSVERSPRKLFDLINGINTALHEYRGDSGLASLWSTALTFDVERHDARLTHRLVDRTGSRRRAYLIVEEYQGSPDDEMDRQYVLRWPCSIDAEDVVRSFCRAFERHDVEKVDLVVGTATTIEHFEADVPFALPEIVEAVEPRGADDGPSGEAVWVRMGANDFDLYADLSPPAPQQDPIVGLFVGELNATHTVDLYVRTSARYVFPAWLRAALAAIGPDSAQAAAAEVG